MPGKESRAKLFSAFLQLSLLQTLYVEGNFNLPYFYNIDFDFKCERRRVIKISILH